jgi:hypothetical protein
MVTKLTKHVDPKKGNLLNFGFEQQYLILKIYLKSIKSVFLEEWENPDTLILKTVGFGGIMNAFYEVFTLTVQSTPKFSTENTIILLQNIAHLKFNTETFPGGGIKAQDAAAVKIITELKKAIRGNDAINVEISEE